MNHHGLSPALMIRIAATKITAKAAPSAFEVELAAAQKAERARRDAIAEIPRAPN